MTDILLNWINNEVKLSKKIQNIEEDFSNGYFFGELLYKYKLLPQFNQFKNSNDKSSITRNYLLLQYKFDDLKINFSDSDKRELVNKKKYKAEMVLFQIREKLFSKLLQIGEITERISNQREINMIYKHVLNNTKINKRIKSAKPGAKLNIINTNKKEIKESDKNKKQNQIQNIKKKRLESAKLPKLSKNALNIGKNKQIVSAVNNIVSNDILTKDENKEVKDALKEIELFENIHMKTKKNIELLEKKMHENEELKEKQNYDSWKKSYQKIKQFEEEKKQKGLQRIKRLKSATKNSFNRANQNLVANINKFDINLDHLGLNAKNNINFGNAKKNEISGEKYMKSIIDAVKEKEILRKQHEIRMRRLNSPNKLDNIVENKKENEKNMDKNQGRQRPKSSATTVMFYSNKNKNADKDKIESFDNDKNRPFTAKNNLKKEIDFNENIVSSQNQKNIRPKSGFNININNKATDKNDIELSIGSQLSRIEENASIMNSNKGIYNNLFEDEYTNIDVYDEKKFFEKVYQESGNYYRNKANERHKEIIYNRNIIKNVVYSLLDITDLCYNYKNEHNTKLVDSEEWNKMIHNFLNDIPIIPKKEKPKLKKEEGLDNSSFNIYNSFKKEQLREFGQYEYDELKNYIYFIGEKYDPAKNCLFVKKCKLGQDKLDINDVMGEEDIKILFDEANKVGRQIFDEDDKDDSVMNGNKMKYKANKEEQEILEPFKDRYPSNLIFTNLISESIKFSYDKDPLTFEPKDHCGSKVIEEEINIQQADFIENEGSAKKLINENEKNEKSKANISEENKNEHNSIGEDEKIINIKELIESIPIRVSFLGVQKTEKKTRAKNLIKKYPGLKIYNLAEFKKNLEQENKELNDENIIDLLINKIKEDFSFRNKEDIKKEIIKKREDINNLNNELEKLKEEQEKKPKFNIVKEMQNIQMQIDKINNDSIVGFILIGIPENIHQLKIMEKKMMEFTQPCERNMASYDVINEKLLFICDQPQKEIKEDEIINLTLNKIVHFETNKDVIFKKIDNRKRDPLKGDIYQMNLFPPRDRRVLVRLVDILKPTHEEIEADITNDINNYELIEEFYKNFNIKCNEFKGYIINENINEINNIKNYLQLLEQNQLELDNKIAKEIEEALLIFEEKIVGKEIENFPFNDESAIIENNNESTLGKDKDKEKSKSKKESELSGGEANNNNANTNSNNNQNDGNMAAQQQNVKKENKKDSDNSSMTFINDVSRINSNNYVNTTQGDIASLSQFNYFPPSSLSEAELFNTYHIWKKFIYHYTNQYYKKFNKDKKLGRGKYTERLNSIQKDFIKFLSRPSEKKIIINQFLNKYKEFSNKCKFIQNTNIARTKYLSDIDELNETLWKIVELRKFEALDKIENLTSIIDQELKICYYNIEQMIIFETQKFLEIINILLRFISSNRIVQVNNKNTQLFEFIIENPTEEILRLTNECELAEYNEKSKKYNYPKANRIYKNCLRILIKLYHYLSKSIFKSYEKLISSHQQNVRATKRQKSKKNKVKMVSKHPSSSNLAQFSPANVKSNEVQNQLKVAMKAEIDKYKYIIYNIYINSLESLSKIFCASKLVFKLMDDWIIDSIQYQNNAMNEIFNKLKSYSIEEIIENKNVLSEENIYKNIELDDFSKKFILFNYDEFLSDGNSEGKKNLSIEELNNLNFAENVQKIYKLFTYTENNKVNKIFGDFIISIRNNEIQRGIIKKTTFEKIFFVNKIIKNNFKSIFPQYFYNLDFHNISLFFSHFIKLSKDFTDTDIKDNNEPNEEIDKINEENKEINNNESNKSNIVEAQSNKEIINDINNDNDIISEHKDIKTENEYVKPQELIYTNQILTILFLISFKVISDEEIEIIKKESESKLINGKFLNRNDFIGLKFWFEDIINKKCRNEQGFAEQLKMLLFDLNINNNGLINFNQFIDLVSLKSLHFEEELNKEKIKNYFNLFYN